MKLNLLALLTMVFAVTGQAKQYEKLTRFIDENVETISQAMNASSAVQPMDFGGEWEFKRIFLRLQAKAGFDVEFGKIELIPELELVFQKEKQL